MGRRKATHDGQLDLFGVPAGQAKPEPPRKELLETLEQRFSRLRELALGLPDQVRFGTSSWSFPGWSGLVFPPGKTKTQLAREGLPLYVQHPLMRTVGIDRGYYAPISRDDLAGYAQQLPPGFLCCAKVPELFTTPVELGYRQGERGAPNAAFLDAARFTDLVAGPFEEAFAEHTGALILEFPPTPHAHRLEPDDFAERLDAFLEAIPSSLPYCVELRDRTLLTPTYKNVLARHGASHVYNYWSAMPMPAEQLSVVPLDNAPFAVVRLMLRPGTRYAQRKEAFEPFDKLVQPDPDMREQIVDLVELARALKRLIFVLVNNKAEGSAPLTIEELAAQIAKAPGSS